VTKAVVAAALAGLLLAGSGSPAGAAVVCKPGSGPDLTHRKLTQAYFSNATNVNCANLSGVDLSGLDLTQVTMAGANFQNANLENTTLVQATITGSNFTGANLSHAKLGQVSAQGANFSFADLSGADLTQADLTDANFDHSKIGGADFTQASLSGATFAGATGVTPWSMILLIISAVVFVLLAIGPVRRLTSGGDTSGALWGLLGALVAALGVHLFFGGILGLAENGFGTPIGQTCSTGVLCSVGVKSGFFGLFIGLLVLLAGGFLLARSGSGSRAGVRTSASIGG
jgi:hypothetical protein